MNIDLTSDENMSFWKSSLIASRRAFWIRRWCAELSAPHFCRQQYWRRHYSVRNVDSAKKVYQPYRARNGQYWKSPLVALMWGQNQDVINRFWDIRKPADVSPDDEEGVVAASYITAASKSTYASSTSMISPSGNDWGIDDTKATVWTAMKPLLMVKWRERVLLWRNRFARVVPRTSPRVTEISHLHSCTHGATV